VRINTLAAVDVSALAAWIANIDFAEWPQQTPTRADQLRPAMVTDPEWHDFGTTTEAVVVELMERFPGRCRSAGRMLSVVMPHDSIPPHVDRQSGGWITRVHVPIVTNEMAVFYVLGKPFQMRAGMAYLVDIEGEHSIVNDGDGPRIHLMFDVSG